VYVFCDRIRYLISFGAAALKREGIWANRRASHLFPLPRYIHIVNISYRPLPTNDFFGRLVLQCFSQPRPRKLNMALYLLSSIFLATTRKPWSS
jgi:hypothetical protein